MPLADKTSVAERNGMYQGGSLQTDVASRMVTAMGERAERKAREVITDSEYETIAASVPDTSGSILSYDASEYWRLQVGYDVASNAIGFSLQSPTDGAKDFDSGQTLGSGWHHVAVTFDTSRADEIEIIYDGSSVHTASVTDWGAGTTRFGVFGVESGASSYKGSVTTGQIESWNGLVDEAIYLVGRALSVSEVSSLKDNPALYASDSAAVWSYGFESDSLTDRAGNSTAAELRSDAVLTTYGRYGKALDLSADTGARMPIDHSHSASGKTDNFTIACWVNAATPRRAQLKEAESYLIFAYALRRMNLRLTKKGGAVRRTGTVDNENDLMTSAEIESYADEAFADGIDLLEETIATEAREDSRTVYAI